jgi:hypothetical protein
LIHAPPNTSPLSVAAKVEAEKRRTFAVRAFRKAMLIVTGVLLLS